MEAPEQFASVGAHRGEPGDGMAGLGTQAHRPPIALRPLGGNQLVQHLRRVVGHGLQDGADRLGQ
jgi:hypothetical protein